MPQLGRKGMRKQPELYTEVKIPTSLSLTPTGRKLLDGLAQARNLSRSELIDRIARGEIRLQGENAG